MEAINSLSGGMNSDLSKTVHPKDSYLQAINFRNLTEVGSSNGSLVNIKGTEYKIQLPELKDMYKLMVGLTTTGTMTLDGNVTIDINGESVNIGVVNTSTLGLTIYNALKSLANCYNTTNGTPITPIFDVSYANDYVVIYQQPQYELLTPAPTTLVITITLNNAADAEYTIYFVDTTNNTSVTQTPFINGTSDLIIIGSTYIDNDIYLFSAEDNDTQNAPHPNDSFANLGTIWKLEINDITRNCILTLIYNNLLDFTKFYPIAPSAALGRYESSGLQRLYWTDFYNSIKTLNVSDPQLMATKPSLISIFPSVSFEIPLLTSFITGNLRQGTYELSYRLKKSLGQITNYSQLSNSVNLILDESNVSLPSYLDYVGPTSGLTNSGRGIRWTIDNIDNKFDTIELVVSYRDSKTDLPVIYVSNERSVGTSSSYIAEITDISNFNTIELTEFQNISSGFTHAKTVETKDNRLFWGNVKSIAQKSIGDLFDARAFRAKVANDDTTIYVVNNGLPPVPITLTQAEASPKTDDNINPYYDSVGDVDANACYYQPGTAKLGGIGANISYEFGTDCIVLSDLASTVGSVGDWLIRTTVPFSNKTGYLQGLGSSVDLIQGTTDSDNQVYPFPQSVATAKNPYFTSLMKGYQPEEIYRFGIQFFDLQGNPYFTEWIGDIKFPTFADTNDNPGGAAGDAGITDFRSSLIYNDGVFGQTIYIKFTVDVSSVVDYISGYQIVRVERDSLNKTILGYGVLTNTYNDTTTGDAVVGGGLYLDREGFPNLLNLTPPLLNQGIPYNPHPDQDAVETLSQATNITNDLTMSNRMVMFDCFDFLTNGYSFQQGDKILIRSKISPHNRERAKAGNSNSRYRIAFSNLNEWLDNPATVGVAPSYSTPSFNWSAAPPKWQTGYDSETAPIYMLFYVDHTLYSGTSNDRLIGKGTFAYDGGTILAANTGTGIEFKNYMRTFINPALILPPPESQPGQGNATVLLTFEAGFGIESAMGYGAASTTGRKLMGLYYRPNLGQYNGNTYSSRVTNEYIPCGSYIPIKRNDQTLANNEIITFNCYGGDIFINYWDHQKVIKDATGTEIKMYDYQGGGDPGSSIGDTISPQFRLQNIFYYPCINTTNQAVRYGHHPDKNLVDDFSYFPTLNDEYLYQTYNSNERNINKFIPKPLNFLTNDMWRNRVFYSEIKIDNEIQDSWTNYLTDHFYDVEGNYGPINCLISLNSTMYYIQEKGFGMLLINPVSMINDSLGQPIKLGSGTQVIQKHYYKSIDVGTSHQWSVFRSSNAIAFIDVRHKKIFMFNGESLTPISDIKGQRNFVIKRLHDDILTNDNPIINIGLLTTYDYYHNEFLFTFLNAKDVEELEITEKMTLSFSEMSGNFVSMYSFTPNLFINNNKYLFSTNSSKKIYLHNYGQYCKFYDNTTPSESSIKLLVNDNPLYTKVFDNISLMSDTIDDNIQWSDDLNVYPGSIEFPAYPDDVNYKDNTFNEIRVYNDYQNSDWVTLNITPPTNNIRRVERSFNLQIPRNKFNYDTTANSTFSIFDTSKLTKTTFGERMRDKWLNVDLKYNNLLNLRFVIHNIKTLFRISDR